jgi:hypothetical protein
MCNRLGRGHHHSVEHLDRLGRGACISVACFACTVFVVIGGVGGLLLFLKATA